MKKAIKWFLDFTVKTLANESGFATISKGKTFTTTETVTNTKLHQLVDSATISGIVTADISDSQITAAKLATDAVETAKIKDANITTAKIADDAVDADKLAILTTKGDLLGYSTEPARQAVGTNGDILVADSTTATGVDWKTATEAGIGGIIVQVVNTSSTAHTATSTAIPADDTAPQSSEGAEMFTRTITPNSATNNLKIDVVVQGDVSTAGVMCAALYKDAGANAVASGTLHRDTSTGGCITFTYFVAAGSTSEQTWKVRAGSNNGTFTLNENNNNNYGDTLVSGITITEITV